MHKTAVKYFIVISLFLIFINRALFVSVYEFDSQGCGETNSVIEWIYELITGESNDIDEDGDTPNDFTSISVFQHDFTQHLSNSNGLNDLYSKNIEKYALPRDENLPLENFFKQIDHPPRLTA